MLSSQRSLVLVAVVLAVFFSAFIAARSSYKGKLKKNNKGFLIALVYLAVVFDIVKTLLFC